MATYYFMNQTVGSTICGITDVTLTNTYTNDNLQWITCLVHTSSPLPDVGFKAGMNVYISGVVGGIPSDMFCGPQVIEKVIDTTHFTFLTAFYEWYGGIITGTGGTVSSLTTKTGSNCEVDNIANYYTDVICSIPVLVFPAFSGNMIEVTPGSFYTCYTLQPGHTPSYSDMHIGGSTWITIRRGGILYVTGQDSAFNTATSTFQVYTPQPVVGFGAPWRIIASFPPIFKDGSIVKTKYSAYSFNPSLQISDQTLPCIDSSVWYSNDGMNDPYIADSLFLGSFSLDVRNSTGVLVEPNFHPQVIPHRNGAVDGNSMSIVTKLSVGRYTVKSMSPAWGANDLIDLYVSIQTVTSAATYVMGPPWQEGGGTTPAGCGHRWYRTRVEDKTGYTLNSSGLNAIPTDAVMGTGIAETWDEMMVQVWRRFFRPATLSETELKTYNDTGSLVLTTQPVSTVDGVQIQGKAV